MDLTKLSGGHGLGLYICKNLVELMHGNISVKSVRNSGTTISLNIQCKKSQQGLSESVNATFPTLSSNANTKRSILLVCK